MHNGKAALMDWMEEDALSHRVMRSIHNLEWTGAAIAFFVVEDDRVSRPLLLCEVPSFYALGLRKRLEYAFEAQVTAVIGKIKNFMEFRYHYMLQNNNTRDGGSEC